MSSTDPEPMTEPSPRQPTARDYRREVTDNVIHLLEQGVAPWQKPWEAGASFGMPTNPTTGKTYRGGNAIHLLTTGLRKGYGDPRWMTYKQASEQGWQVRKGERGTHIEFWEIRGSPQKSGDHDPTRVEPDAERDQTRWIHRVYTVFNAQQIDGIPAYVAKQHTTFEAVQAGEQILQNSGAEIVYDQIDRAYYSRAEDRIHLPPRAAFRDAASFYGTALHEVAHHSGHPSRLNRPTLTESYRFGDTNYAKEELRAELASLFLAAERGIPHDPAQHAAYLDSWIEILQRDQHEIFRAAHDASAAVDYLLALERGRSLGSDQLRPEPTLEAYGVAAVDRQASRDGAGAMTQHPQADVVHSLWAADAIVAKALGASARLLTPQVDGGIYRGVILGETPHHIIQRQSGQLGIAHRKDSLDGQPQAGEYVRIQYAHGKGTVRVCCERAQAAERGR